MRYEKQEPAASDDEKGIRLANSWPTPGHLCEGTTDRCLMMQSSQSLGQYDAT